MLLVFKAAVVGSAALLIFGGAGALAQAPEKDNQNSPSQSTQWNPKNRPKMQQKIVVTDKLTPEEVEEWKINGVYQDAYKLQEQNDCAGAIEKYRSVIPVAQQAKFNVPRNKFLFLSYRGIGDCDLSMRRFAEAEEMYQKTFEYASVWPGIDNSAYPINYRSIGLARMAQQNWKGAEEALQEAITIFDEQIERSLHPNSDVGPIEDIDNLRMSQDVALNFLAAVYAREQRPQEALILLERAYHQATTYNAPATVIKKIVETGLTISTLASDSATSDIWFQRSKALK